MTGREPSAFSMARLIDRSSTVLFHVGSSWASANRPTSRAGVGVGARARRRARTARCGRTRSPPTGGGRADRPPRGPGARPACGCPGRSPTGGACPARAAGRPRRPRRRARAGRRGRAPAAGRGRSRRRGRRRAAPPRGSPRPGPCAVGPWFAPLTKRRSPLTDTTQSRIATCRSPVRERPPVAGPVRAVGGDLDGDVLERLVAERVRPPEPGLGDRHGPLELVLAAGQRDVLGVVGAADGGGDRWRRRPRPRRARPAPRRRPASRRPGGTAPAGAGCGSAPVVSMRDRPPDAAGVPVGVEAVPVLEDAR